MDHLTKWVEAFPMSDQWADTIARLFVEHVVCRHGVPEQLLSDRGTNFLSDLIRGVCDILGVEKINTSGYHPQTDSLVEKFNSTLVSMIAKCCETKERDWDEHLPYLLFAYRTMMQESTQESPFYLVYGRDPRLPTETGLTMPAPTYMVDAADYRQELVAKLSTAWATAKENIQGAQDTQKVQYDRKAGKSGIKVGDRVMVFMSSSVQGKERKLARPYHGPYRVLKVTPTNAEVTLIDKPRDPAIFVSLKSSSPLLQGNGEQFLDWATKDEEKEESTPSTCPPPDEELPPVSPDPSPERESEPEPERIGPMTRSTARARANQ